MKKSLPWIIGCLMFLLALWGVIELAATSRTQSIPSGTQRDLHLTQTDWISGSENASVTLVEYSDFQCPACGAYYPIVKQLKEIFPTQLRVVYRHFPLTTIHRNAKPAARVAEAAGRQEKFWDMHDLLFERQGNWSTTGNPSGIFASYAKELGLDTDRFTRDLGSSSIDNNITAGINSGTALKVQGTPTFFLNGKQIPNPRSIEEFKKKIDDAMKNAPPQTINQPTNRAYHAHADLFVMLEGKPLDLSLETYQSTKERELDPNVHLHDRKPNILHLHKEGVTLKTFFSSLSMNLSGRCLHLKKNNLETYCPEAEDNLVLYLNGIRQLSIEDYEPKDLDQLLITKENTDEKTLKQQLALISDEACIYSEKCPERGKPLTEECVGGLGTKCH